MRIYILQTGDWYERDNLMTLLGPDGLDVENLLTLWVIKNLPPKPKRNNPGYDQWVKENLTEKNFKKFLRSAKLKEIPYEELRIDNFYEWSV